jgi:predicted PurR-regulated permease PerM
MKQKTFQSFFFLATLCGVLVLAACILLPFFASLVLAAVFAVMFSPLYQKVLRLVHGRRGVAANIVLLCTSLLFFVPAVLLGSKIFIESRDFYTIIRSDQEKIISNFQLFWSQQKTLSRYLPQLPTDFGTIVEQVAGWVVGHLGGFFSGTLQVFMGLFVGIIAFYYFLKDGQKFIASIMVLSPLPDAYDRQILSRIQLAITSVVRGSLLVALIQGLISGIGYTLFAVPGAAFLGVLTAIGALVPGIGTAAVIFPVVVFLLLSGNLASGIGLLCWGIVAVGLIDNILGPRLVGRGLRIHPFFVLVSVLGGVSVFGPFGFIIGPMVLALLFAFLDLYKLLILKEGKVSSK